MIVKNEAECLANCLGSVRDIVDEIVVVDTGSTDNTKEIAATFNAKIFDFVWVDDFSAARNYSFSKATCDYILWLDADDILLKKDKEKLSELKNNLDQYDVAMLKYNTGFDADGAVTFSFFRERLVKRSRGFLWHEPVHEYIETFGNITRCEDIAITHAKPHQRVKKRNLNIYQSLIKSGKKLTPRGTYYYARELFEAQKYKKAATQFSAFLKQGLGWVEDNIAACCLLSQCYTHLKNPQKSLAALTKSFEFDTPRPEVCCHIGYHFLHKNSYTVAAYWFNLALVAAKNYNGKGFRNEDYFGYIPLLELAVCHDRLGNTKKASRYNEAAGFFKPSSQAVARNRDYFKSLQKED